MNKPEEKVLVGEEQYSGRQSPAFERIVRTSGGGSYVASQEEIDEIKDDHIKSDSEIKATCIKAGQVRFLNPNEQNGKE